MIKKKRYLLIVGLIFMTLGLIGLFSFEAKGLEQIFVLTSFLSFLMGLFELIWGFSLE